MRSTKIVATLGPATSTPERIAELIESGMDVARINFSHGSHDEHRVRIAAVREAASRADRAVAILQDLQGPKIRTGMLEGGEPVTLEAGASFVLTTEQIAGDATRVATGYDALPDDVFSGARILLSDGAIELRVEKVVAGEVHTTIVVGGTLAERQGIHLPGIAISAPTLSDKDLADLEFGLAEGVDIVALSFVRTAADIHAVKERIAAAGATVPVVAKIERAEAMETLVEILEAADGAMVARGDLGVEMPPEQVPLAQKRIIAEANRLAVPVITATQMLESMIDHPNSTRAEASDVANAMIDGTDAVMLSGETAVGRHPVRAIETAARIAEEMWANRASIESHLSRARPAHAFESSAEAVCAAAADIVRRHRQVCAIWVLTRSGRTARLVSAQRPSVPIIGFTPNRVAYQRMSILWGVTPVFTAEADDFDCLERDVTARAFERALAQPGDVVVITGSHPFESNCTTNFVKVLELPA